MKLQLTAILTGVFVYEIHKTLQNQSKFAFRFQVPLHQCAHQLLGFSSRRVTRYSFATFHSGKRLIMRLFWPGQLLEEEVSEDEQT